MRNHYHRLAIGVVVAGLGWATLNPGVAHAQLKPTKLSKAVALLGGRLHIDVPAAAKVIARRGSIMSAPESATGETRVMLDAGDERLVLMTWEIYRTSTGSLTPGVKAYLAARRAPKTAAIRASKTKDGLQTVWVTPKSLSKNRQANVVLRMFVASSDRTVQMMVAYVNKVGASKGPARVKRLATAIFKTLRGGKRKLKLKARREKLRRIEKRQLSVAIPANHLLSHQRGHDFDVYRLMGFVPLGKTPPAFGLYVGGHPARHSRSQKNVTKHAGKVLGKSTQWHQWQKNGVEHWEALVKAGGREHLHVFFSGSKSQIAHLKKIAASLRLK